MQNKYLQSQARSWASLQKPTSRLPEIFDGIMVAIFLVLLFASWFVVPALWEA